MSEELRPVAVRIADQASTLGPQNQVLTPFLSRLNAPVDRLSAGWVEMEPGRAAAPHVHDDSELIVIVARGAVTTLWGERLEPIPHVAGEAVWVPAGLVHAGVNLSAAVGAELYEVRTDPWFNDDVRLRPDLDGLLAIRVAELTRGVAG